MIPKVIHYCWFGGNPLPESAQKCISSWRKYFPGWEIKEWNENNFDVNSIPYTAQAYAAKKYAFVSDYARFKVLYEHGGIYFDTDVEVIKSFDDILSKGPFMGFEINPDGKSYFGDVNPGLGLGASSGMSIYKKIIDTYQNFAFLNTDGTQNLTTVVKYTTSILIEYGLKNKEGIQLIEGINIYPEDYFNPFDDATGRLKTTKNTHSIHWYSKTWLKGNPWRTKMARILHRIFGTEFTSRFRSIFNK